MAYETNPPATEGKVPEPQGHFAARVPERVARGVYTSAQVLIEAPKEIMIDFLMGLTRPFNVVSRVIVTPQTLSEFINALERNLDGYIQAYGPPPTPPIPPNQKTPTLEEIYENFKLP